MIVNMVENPNIQETKITIECSKADSQILKIISLINNYENNDKKIIGISKDQLLKVNSFVEKKIKKLLR